jgi:hypothetical protein
MGKKDRTMIDATFVEAIAGKAVKAVTPAILDAKGEPSGFYYLVQDGKAVLVRAQRPTQSTSLASFEMFEQFTEDVGTDTKLNKPSIIVARTGCSLVFDRYNMRDSDRAQVSFQQTKHFEYLCQSQHPALEQKQFLRAFRDLFSQCFDGSQALQKNISEIRWENTANGASTVRNGEESLGNAIVRKVQGMDSINPEMTLVVQPFQGIERRYPCRCYLEIDATTRMFKLYPYPDETDNILRKSLSDIRGMLVERFKNAIPVYIG